MKRNLNKIIPLALLLLTCVTPSSAVTLMTGTPVLDGILSTILYSLIGIVMAFVSYRVVDLMTPGHLSKQIAEGNVALALLSGCSVLGVSIIIAAAISS